MKISPLQQYHQDLIAKHFVKDPAQERAIILLDSVYHALIEEVNARERWTKIFRRPKLIQSCYLWGNVGTGKSYLMSTFFHCLPFKKKLRLHFHEFMQKIHQSLNELQGNKDPLKIVAKQWAQKTHVLCFDEFFVKDIADAMTLFNILKALFAEGICLTATSNVPLNDLYKNGLQRDRFLPAIKLLQKHVTEIHVDNQVDYRLRHNRPAHTFFTPLNDETDHKMIEAFHYYANNDISYNEPIIIHGRPIQTVLHTKSILWCTFHELCETLRSTEDYLLIAQQFSVLMISKINVILKRDTILRFINLIDVMYDNHILLFISAEVGLDKLYQGDAIGFEFRRTKSRLIEMDTENYLKECHSPHPNPQAGEEIALPLSDITLKGLAWGNPKHPLILAIHGWLDNAGSFIALAQKLTDYYFVALDMPGQGQSLLSPNEPTPSFHRMVKLIPEAIDALTDKPAILIAHSIGTGFATYIAAHTPDKISKVILLDGLGVLSKELSESPSTLADMCNTFISTERLPARTYKTLDDMLKFRARITGLSVESIRPIVKRGSQKTDTGHQWNVDSRLSLATLADFSEEEALSFLRKAHVPVLLIIGKKRRLIPVGNELIEARMNAVKNLTVVDLDAGHHLHISHADDVATIILDFLNRKNDNTINLK